VNWTPRRKTLLDMLAPPEHARLRAASVRETAGGFYQKAIPAQYLLKYLPKHIRF
jgi:hypothetical protein